MVDYTILSYYLSVCTTYNMFIDSDEGLEEASVWNERYLLYYVKYLLEYKSLKAIDIS